MKKNKITNCHSEEALATEESFNRFFAFAQNDGESGRSMVEMLGVLAVIGVLSVAGIAGYSNAMNKHRANELIYEASKRAVVLAMQITQGKTGTLSIDEFTNNKIGTAEFKNPTYATGADTFTMTLTGVNEAVCNQMKTTAGENGGLKINGTCGDSLTLTFTKDLSAGNTNCDGVKCGSTCCPNGTTCDDGKCCSEGICAEEGQELYCDYTNSEGQCAGWDTCPEGRSSTDRIVGVPDADGDCAGDGYELYCYSTNSEGQCTDWDTCDEGKSTTDRIVGVPDASAAAGCAGDGYELYCYSTNSEGQCTEWNTCPEGKSSTDRIVGLPDTWGACAGDGYELYCYSTNSEGQCVGWESCYGKSSGDSIIGTPNATGTCD